MIVSILAVYWPLLLILCIIGALYVTLQQKSSGLKSLPLLPQPRGSLILGNMPEVIKESPVTLQHLLMQKWAREYGEVFRVRFGLVTEYFLNSDRAIKVGDSLSSLL